MNTDTLVPKGKFEGKRWLFNSNLTKKGKWIRTIANDGDSEEYTYFDFNYENKTSEWCKLDLGSMEN